jgi:hypothetical protein
VCETELADTGTYYDTTTGKFTPLVAGTYVFTGKASISSLGDGKQFAVSVRKNGTIIERLSRQYMGAAGNPIGGGTARFYLDGADDYVELIVFHDHGSNRDTIPGDTEFSAWRVSPIDICGV